jgi:hypothetical protein
MEMLEFGYLTFFTAIRIFGVEGGLGNGVGVG